MCYAYGLPLEKVWYSFFFYSTLYSTLAFVSIVPLSISSLFFRVFARRFLCCILVLPLCIRSATVISDKFVLYGVLINNTFLALLEFVSRATFMSLSGIRRRPLVGLLSVIHCRPLFQSGFSETASWVQAKFCAQWHPSSVVGRPCGFHPPSVIFILFPLFKCLRFVFVFDNIGPYGS